MSSILFADDDIENVEHIRQKWRDNDFISDIFFDTIDISSQCLHTNFFVEKGLEICKDCGVMTSVIDMETKLTQNNCKKIASKNKTSSVFKKYEDKINASINIKEETENRFCTIINNNKEDNLNGNGNGETSYRKRNKIGFTLVCYYDILTETNTNTNLSIKDIKNIGCLSDGEFNKCRRKYLETYGKNKKYSDLINFNKLLAIELSKLQLTNEKYYTDMIEIYNTLKQGKAKIIFVSKLSSFIAGLIMYYINNSPYYKETHQRIITKYEVIKTTEISDMTINKVSKSIVAYFEKHNCVSNFAKQNKK